MPSPALHSFWAATFISLRLPILAVYLVAISVISWKLFKNNKLKGLFAFVVLFFFGLLGYAKLSRRAAAAMITSNNEIVDNARIRARDASIRLNLSNLSIALNQYKKMNGHYPVSLSEINATSIGLGGIYKYGFLNPPANWLNESPENVLSLEQENELKRLCSDCSLSDERFKIVAVGIFDGVFDVWTLDQSDSLDHLTKK